MTDFEKLLGALKLGGVEFIVIGGVAAIARVLRCQVAECCQPRYIKSERFNGEE